MATLYGVNIYNKEQGQYEILIKYDNCPYPISEIVSSSHLGDNFLSIIGKIKELNIPSISFNKEVPLNAPINPNTGRISSVEISDLYREMISSIKDKNSEYIKSTDLLQNSGTYYLCADYSIDFYKSSKSYLTGTMKNVIDGDTFDFLCTSGRGLKKYYNKDQKEITNLNNQTFNTRLLSIDTAEKGPRTEEKDVKNATWKAQGVINPNEAQGSNIDTIYNVSNDAKELTSFFLNKEAIFLTSPENGTNGYDTYKRLLSSAIFELDVGGATIYINLNKTLLRNASVSNSNFKLATPSLMFDSLGKTSGSDTIMVSNIISVSLNTFLKNRIKEDSQFSYNKNIPEELAKSEAFMRLYNSHEITPVYNKEDDTFYIVDKKAYFAAPEDMSLGEIAQIYNASISEICLENNLNSETTNGQTIIEAGTVLIIPVGVNVSLENIDIMQASGQYRVGEKSPNQILVPADSQFENYDEPRIDDRDKLDGIIRYINQKQKDSNIYDENGDIVNPIYSPYGKHYLRIGDCTVPISPLSISVNRQSTNNRVQTIRSKNSIQTQTGHSAKKLTINLAFNRLEQINGEETKGLIPGQKYYRNGLRPLIAQFMKAPFLPIENELINDVHKVFNVALLDFEIRTVPGFPEVIMATLELIEFDHTVYMPDSGWFEGHFCWPLFRWYYQQTLNEVNKNKGHRYIAPMIKLQNQFEFYIPDENVLAQRQAAIKELIGKAAPGLVEKEAQDELNKYPGEIDLSLGMEQFGSFREIVRTYPSSQYHLFFNKGYFDMSEIKSIVSRPITGEKSAEENIETIKYATAALKIYTETYKTAKKACYVIKGLDQEIINDCVARMSDISRESTSSSEYVGILTGTNYGDIESIIPISNNLHLQYSGRLYNQSGESISKEDAENLLSGELKEEGALGASIWLGIAAAIAAAAVLAFFIPATIGVVGGVAAWALYGSAVSGLGTLAGVLTYNGVRGGLEKELFGDGPTKDLYNTIIIQRYNNELQNNPNAISGTLIINVDVTNDTAIALVQGDFNTIKDDVEIAMHYFIPANYPALSNIGLIYNQIKSMAAEYKEKIERLQYLTHMTEKDIPIIHYEIDGEYFIQEMKTSMSNNFAPAYLQMQEGPAIQYLGCKDLIINAKIKTKDRKMVEGIQDLVTTMHRLARSYRIAITSGVLTIRNPFFDLFGIDSVLIENIDVATSQNDSESFDIDISFVSFDKTQRRKEELDQFGFGDNFEGLDDFKRFVRERRSSSGEDLGNVDMKLREAELYPDLELPTYEEVNEALKYLKLKDSYGNPFLKYPNYNRGKYVDPDFYIRQEITQRDIIEAMLDDDASGELALVDKYGNFLIDKAPSKIEQRATNSDIEANPDQQATIIMGDTAITALKESLPKMKTAAMIAGIGQKPASFFTAKAYELAKNNPGNQEIPETNTTMPPNMSEETKSLVTKLGERLSRKTVSDIPGMSVYETTIGGELIQFVAYSPSQNKRVLPSVKQNNRLDFPGYEAAAKNIFGNYAHHLMEKQNYTIDDIKNSQIALYFDERLSDQKISTNDRNIAQKIVPELSSKKYSSKTFEELGSYMIEYCQIKPINLDLIAANDTITRTFLLNNLREVINFIGSAVLQKDIPQLDQKLNETQKQLLLEQIQRSNTYSSADEVVEQIAQIGTLGPPTFESIENFVAIYPPSSTGLVKTWNELYATWKDNIINNRVFEDKTKNNVWGIYSIPTHSRNNSTNNLRFLKNKEEIYYSIPKSLIKALLGLNPSIEQEKLNSYYDKWYFRTDTKGNITDVILKCESVNIKPNEGAWYQKLSSPIGQVIFGRNLTEVFVPMTFDSKNNRWRPKDETLTVLDRIPQGGIIKIKEDRSGKEVKKIQMANTSGIEVKNGYAVVDFWKFGEICDIHDPLKEYDISEISRLYISLFSGKVKSEEKLSSERPAQDQLFSETTRDKIIRVTMSVPMWKKKKLVYSIRTVVIIDSYGELKKAHQAKFGEIPNNIIDYGDFYFGKLDSSGNNVGGHPTPLSLTVYEILKANMTYELTHRSKSDNDSYFVVVKGGTADEKKLISSKSSLEARRAKTEYFYQSIQREISSKFNGEEGNDSIYVDTLRKSYSSWLCSFHLASEINTDETILTHDDIKNIFDNYTVAELATAQAEQAAFEEVYGGRYFNDLEDPDIKRLYRSSFDNIFKYDQRNRLVRAFPTYQMFLIDEGAKTWAYRMWDNFYGYNSLVSIDVIKDRRIVADTAVIEMTNVYHNLSEYDNELTYGKGDFTAFDAFNIFDGARLKSFWASVFGIADISMVEARQQQVESLFLKPGARLHLRFGYGSNALNLPVVFNGTVTEVNTDEIITIIAQGDGIELTNKLIKNPMDTTDPGCFVAPYEPREFIGQIMTAKGGFWKSVINRASGGRFFKNHPLGIFHFGNPDRVASADVWNSIGAVRGFKSLFDITDEFGEAAINVYGGGKERSFSQWKYRDSDSKILDKSFNLSLSDSNEGSSFLQKSDGSFGLRWNNGDVVPRLQYNDAPNTRIYLHDMTPYDVFQSYAATCSDYICAVRPFEFRSTLYFGKPNWGICDGYYYINYWDQGFENIKKKKLGYERKCFSQTHLISSYTDIIKNNIQATSSLMKTNVSVIYNEKNGPKQTAVIQVDSDLDPVFQTTGTVSIPIKADNGLLNTLGIYNYFNQHKYAETAGISQLRDWVKDMYQGEVVILGDATINPYDTVYMKDFFADMNGIFEVKRVTHHIAQDTGFISTIQPDCCCVADDSSKASMLTWIATKADNALMYVAGNIVGRKLMEVAVKTPIAYTIKRLGKKALSLSFQHIYFGQSKISSFEKHLIQYYCDDIVNLTKKFSTGNPNDAKGFVNLLVDAFNKDILSINTEISTQQAKLFQMIDDGAKSGKFYSSSVAKELIEEISKLTGPEKTEKIMSFILDGNVKFGNKSEFYAEVNKMKDLLAKEKVLNEGISKAYKSGHVDSSKIKFSKKNGIKLKALAEKEWIKNAQSFLDTWTQKGKLSGQIDELVKKTKFATNYDEVVKIYKSLRGKPFKQFGTGLLRGTARLGIFTAKKAANTTAWAVRQTMTLAKSGTALATIGSQLWAFGIGLLVDTAFEHYVRWKRHRQALVIIPLLYRGRYFTAGLNGAKGSVLGTSMGKLDSFLMGEGYNPDSKGVIDHAVKVINAVAGSEADYQHKEATEKWKKYTQQTWGTIQEDIYLD